jgi:hypothetical protein
VYIETKKEHRVKNKRTTDKKQIFKDNNDNDDDNKNNNNANELFRME